MGRIGIRLDEMPKFTDDFRKLKNLQVEGLMTHFASAENPEDNDFTELQVHRFYTALKISYR